MIDPFLLTLLLGFLVGIMLAITGAGGAILSLPLLVFFAHMKMIDAAPISLMAITFAAGLGAVIGLKHGIVRYKAAGLLASFGVLMAPLGVIIAHQLSEKILGILFFIVLLTVAWRSIKKIQTPISVTEDGCDGDEQASPACAVNPVTSKFFWTAHCTKLLILTGVISGFLSGLLGVGGGFIIVPTLHSISNLQTKSIVATSLAVITLVSTASVLSYAGHGGLNWQIAIPFVLGSLLGMLIGKLVNHKISTKTSLIIFAILAFAVAVGMLIKVIFSGQ
jgi:uncharacterized membrane protein YfcA